MDLNSMEEGPSGNCAKLLKIIYGLKHTRIVMNKHLRRPMPVLQKCNDFTHPTLQLQHGSHASKATTRGLAELATKLYTMDEVILVEYLGKKVEHQDEGSFKQSQPLIKSISTHVIRPTNKA